MHRSSLLAFLVASATAFAVWALSPWLTEHNEPWDAPGVYYYVALLVAGAVAGLIAAKPLWAHYLGGIFGQLLYGLLFLPMGPLVIVGLLLVGLLFLGLWSLLFLAGAYAGSFMRTLVGNR